MAETVDLKQDEMYCSSCAKPIKKAAAFCVNCGVPTHNQQQNQVQVVTLPKSKTTAVLLAVFLSFWTWLYSYHHDSWKFWLNLVLTVATFGFWGLPAWIWAIIDVAVRPESFYTHYSATVTQVTVTSQR